MELGKRFDNAIDVFKNGFHININIGINKDIVNSLIFCATLVIIILGFPNSSFNGVISWIFKAGYPQYANMEIIHQFNIERLIWSHLKVSFFIALSIFLATITWIYCFLKINRKSLKITSAIHFYLFLFRWIFSLQLIAMIILPFISVKILDINNPLHSNVVTDNISFFMMKKEMKILGSIVILYFAIFLYQAKKFQIILNLSPRRWVLFINQNISFSALIPCILGISASSIFYNYMKTSGTTNKANFAYNYCVYWQNNPNIQSYNATKATMQETGCRKFSDCFKMTDERLLQICIDKIYYTSENFKFLAKNEKRKICQS